MGAFDSITNDNVKSYFGYTLTDKDSRLTIVRPLIASQIENYCNNDFQHTERADEEPIVPEGRKIFFTKYRPISEISELKVNDVVLTKGTDFYFNKNTGGVERLPSTLIGSDYSPYWTTERGAIVLTYIGGEALPNDVIMVFYELVGLNVGMKTKGFITEEGVEGVITLKSLPLQLQAVLDKHKKINVFANGYNSAPIGD